MKIELKRVQYNADLSKGSNCFTADLYIDGKNAGTASNNGRGGNTIYEAVTPEGKDLIRKAEEYFKAKEGTRNLEPIIDRLADNFMNEKERNKFDSKLKRMMAKGVVFGIPGTSFEAIVYKITLAELLTTTRGTTSLVALIANEVVPELKGGVMILNTNIPDEVYKRVGLKEGQYIKQVETPAPKIAQHPDKKPGKKL